MAAPENMRRVFDELGLVVLERGWLSSNNIVFVGAGDATVVDTGYDSHAAQTLDLVQRALGGRALERVVNTHLHSDHCGGNAALQRAHGCEAWVPAPSFDAARQWDAARLTYESTGQRCERFAVQRALDAGDRVRLGGRDWRIVEAPGHDPEAVMLFEPSSRVLISADALWSHGLAIVFPEVFGGDGFDGVRRVLDAIEQLQPQWVIPGHGPAFGDVGDAIRSSRARLQRFVADPERHLAHAMRALVAFRMLEIQRCTEEELVRWMLATPVFAAICARGGTAIGPESRAASALARLLDDGVLRRQGSHVVAR